MEIDKEFFVASDFFQFAQYFKTDQVNMFLANFVNKKLQEMLGPKVFCSKNSDNTWTCDETEYIKNGYSHKAILFDIKRLDQGCHHDSALNFAKQWSCTCPTCNKKVFVKELE